MVLFPRHSSLSGNYQNNGWRMAILSLGLLQFLAAVYDMRFPHPESQ